MGMSDRIEAFILQLLTDEEDWIELKRNELASVFNCVPSQINYVLSTRFNRENGYITESRRGGGGYLRIRRIRSGTLLPYINMIGDETDAAGAVSLLNSLISAGLLQTGDAELIAAAVSDRSIPVNQPYKNRIRACILKNTLLKLSERMEISDV